MILPETQLPPVFELAFNDPRATPAQNSSVQPAPLLVSYPVSGSGSFKALLEALPDEVSNPFDPGPETIEEPVGEVRARQANGDALDVEVKADVTRTRAVEIEISRDLGSVYHEMSVRVLIPHQGWVTRLYSAKDVRRMAWSLAQRYQRGQPAPFDVMGRHNTLT